MSTKESVRAACMQPTSMTHFHRRSLWYSLRDYEAKSSSCLRFQFCAQELPCGDGSWSYATRLEVDNYQLDNADTSGGTGYSKILSSTFGIKMKRSLRDASRMNSKCLHPMASVIIDPGLGVKKNLLKRAGGAGI
ncbi:hypothetical protein BC936DRAFT_139392, partial [Jimgerdemannia flammicorona]